jgi:TonB family protein
MRSRVRAPGLRLALALALAVTAAERSARAHDVEAPHPVTQPAPAWPDGEPSSHDVVVPVVLTVDARGEVEAAVLEASVAPAFDAAALAAVRRWTFEPARRDGKPVSARIRALVRFAGVASVPAAPAPAHAPAAAESEAPAKASPAPPAPEPRASTDTVRVSGSAPPRSASETVKGREILAAAPHRTASDALAVVPGVFVTQHSGEGKAHQIFLRGFDAVHGQDLELWVGGIPVNEVSNIHGQGYSDLHFVMPEVLRDVTAQPGTFDPRQGDFAVAGTLRMRLGYAEPGVTAKGTLGSFGTRRVFLGYHPKDASEETFAAFEAYETDGFGPNRAARRASAMAQGTHDFADGTSLRVLASTYAGRFDSAGVVLARDVEAGRIGRFATYDPKQGGASTRTQLLVELHRDDEGQRWSVAPFVVLRSLALRQNFTGYLADAQRGGADRLASDNAQQTDERVVVGFTASYRKLLPLLSPRDTVELGVYGRHDAVTQTQRRLSDVDDRPTETLVDADVRGTNAAGYLDLALHPLARVAVRGGLRADALAYAAQDRVDSGGSPVPAQSRAAQGAHLGKKATIDWAALASQAGALHVLASYGEGFRSPQARSLSEGERTFFTEVTSWELGVRGSLGRVLTGSLAGFLTRLSDDLAFDPGTARNERVPGTERRGVAADAVVRAGEALLVSSSATYTRAAFTGAGAGYGAGDLLPYVPQLVLRTDATYRRKLGRFGGRDLDGRIGAGLEGLAGRPLPYRDTGQNIALVDATAGVRWKELELGLDVFNLLDARWYDGQFVYPANFGRETSPSLLPTRLVSVGPPRTALLSLTLHL